LFIPVREARLLRAFPKPVKKNKMDLNQIGLALALIILFIHSCTWDGMIFSFARKVIKEDTMLSKPIYNCPICMGPWWGTLMYVTLFGWGSWQEWVLVVGSASGFGVIFVIAIKDTYFNSR
jgi:hypothetical protein